MHDLAAVNVPRGAQGLDEDAERCGLGEAPPAALRELAAAGDQHLEVPRVAERRVDHEVVLVHEGPADPEDVRVLQALQDVGLTR